MLWVLLVIEIIIKQSPPAIACSSTGLVDGIAWHPTLFMFLTLHLELHSLAKHPTGPSGKRGGKSLHAVSPSRLHVRSSRMITYCTQRNQKLWKTLFKKVIKAKTGRHVDDVIWAAIALTLLLLNKIHKQSGTFLSDTLHRSSFLLAYFLIIHLQHDLLETCFDTNYKLLKDVLNHNNVTYASSEYQMTFTNKFPYAVSLEKMDYQYCDHL